MLSCQSDLHAFHNSAHTCPLLDPAPQAVVEGGAAADAVSSRGDNRSTGNSGGSSSAAGRRREGLVAHMRQVVAQTHGAPADVVLRLVQDSIAAVSAGTASPDLLNAMLLWAAQGGNVAAARQLLDTGRCNVGHVGFDGSNALHMAAVKGHTAMLQLLLSSGWDVNSRTFGDDTPITLAALDGHAQAMRALIDAGADVNACNCAPKTALCLAASLGHCDILTMLLNAGADINSTVCLSGAALHFATKIEDLAAVQLLLDRGADPNLPDACGLTPLSWAIHVEVSQPIIDALKRAGGKAPSPLGLMQQVVAQAKAGINFQVRGLQAGCCDRRPLQWMISTCACAGTAFADTFSFSC